MENFKITKREILFSTVILTAMIVLGIWASNPIESKATRKALETISAIQIHDAEEFNYIKRTEAGTFLAEGMLIANDTIKIADIPGIYSRIEKVTEVYTMHVQTYTTTDGKGHTTIKTRTYWTWDVKNRENFETKDYTFLGEKFTKDEIHYHPNATKDTIVGVKTNVRNVYYTNEIATKGTLSGIADKKSYEETRFKSNVTIEQIIKKAENRIKAVRIIFGALWFLLTAGVIIGFCYFENKWLY